MRCSHPVCPKPGPCRFPGVRALPSVTLPGAPVDIPQTNPPNDAFKTFDHWIDGPPTAPGRYWIEQMGYQVLAFVYDGYPDGHQPPLAFVLGDATEKAWREALPPEALGVFLRIRTMEGLAGLRDAELRNVAIDRHARIAPPGE